MSKVKSAIISAIVAIAIVVAAVFGVVSFNTGETERYNSIASQISLGSDFTGYVYTTIYPEGVISQSDYNYLVMDDGEKEEGEDSDAEQYTQYGGVYYNPDEIDYDSVEELAEAVAADAEVLASRFDERGLSDFIVSVRDGITILVGVPSGYSYAEYTGNDTTGLSEAESLSASTIAYLICDGELTLRTSDTSITLESDDEDEDEDEDSGSTYDVTRFEDEYTDCDILGDGSKTYPFVSPNEDAADYFSSVTTYTFGGTHVLNFNLTEYGQERIHYISTLAASSDSQTIYVCVGDVQILSISCTSTIDSDVMQFSVTSQSVARDTATILNSVVNGNALSVTYQSVPDVLSSTATGGESAALMAFIACVALLVIFCAAAVIRYRKLGWVLTMSLFILALGLLYSLYLLEIQVTLAVLAVCAAVVVLFAVANLVVFAEVRSQCKTGKTMQAAVKAGYKRTLLGVLDIHIVILVAAILLAAVADGTVAACGLILVVGAIASYALYWFTRLMWHVCSAPCRDKFAFGGFKREVYGDEDD